MYLLNKTSGHVKLESAVYFCDECDEGLNSLNQCPSCGEAKAIAILHENQKYFLTFDLEAQFRRLFIDPTICEAL